MNVCKSVEKSEGKKGERAHKRRSWEKACTMHTEQGLILIVE